MNIRRSEQAVLTQLSNIGNDANALWKRYDKSVSEEFIIRRQQMHVSILSVCSFVGRLLSGKLVYILPSVIFQYCAVSLPRTQHGSHPTCVISPSLVYCRNLTFKI